MKYRELHRIIRKKGCVALQKKGKGIHKMYTKNGVICTVPYHGGKEIDNDFAKRVLKEMGIEL